MKFLPLPESPKAPKASPRQRVHGHWKPLPKAVSKGLLYGGLAIAVALLTVWAFRPTPVVVDTATVERGTLRVTVDAEGKTRVNDRFVVSAPVDGRVERITLSEGDTVQQGDLVAQIDPLPLTASVREALGQLAAWRAEREGVATQRPKTETLTQATLRIQQAEAYQRQANARVDQAEAALEQAQRDRQRAQELEADGVIPRQERETAELAETTKTKELETARLDAQAAAQDVEVARAARAVLQEEQADPDYLLRVFDARIASTEAELEKLRDDANRTDIRAPAQGEVLRLFQESAQFVSEGTPLLEIGDTSNLELVIDVLSTDAERIRPGDPILIERSDRDPLQAVVRRVEPSAFTKVSALGVEEQRVNVIGDFIDPSTTFGDAYRVDTQIVIWEGNDVLKVPLSALFRCDQDWCVFTVSDERAHQQAIAIDHRSDFEAEVTTGLNADEVVILHPTDQISDGTKVRSP